MKTIPVCVIERNTLFREGLKSILAKAGDYEVAEAHSGIDDPEAKNGESQNIKLVIFGYGGGVNDSKNPISDLKGLYPRSRIVVLSSNTDLKFITSSFSAGVDGYFARDISPDSLLSSLSMIMAGEKVCPAFVLTSLMEDRAGSNGRKGDVSTAHALSGREVEILRHLASGETNKQIAICNNITEATVKVHVKTILRKLSLSNRTQAAIWAFNEGMVDRSFPNTQGGAAAA